MTYTIKILDKTDNEYTITHHVKRIIFENDVLTIEYSDKFAKDICIDNLSITIKKEKENDYEVRR